MKKIKIGKGYYPTDYRKGFRANTTIWLIGNKLYCKDSTYTPYQTDLHGYIMINTSDNTFTSVEIISEHKIFLSKTVRQ